MKITIPYGKAFLSAEMEDRYSFEELSVSDAGPSGEKAGTDIVRAAMEAPYDSPRLRDLAVGKKDAVILLSDHTRPVPSREILPLMLRELRDGNPDIDVTLLIATGCHRAPTREEIEKKIGAETASAEKIAIHDCEGSGNLRLGTLPSGAPLVVNRIAAETQLLLAEGFIEPHFFAGFSGGRKSVLPGICDKTTVFSNHCSAFISDKNARAGVLDGNPIHADMTAAARMIGLKYIVNVILDREKRVRSAFAGDPVSAHRAGCDELLRLSGVRAREKGDILISSNGGYPLDQNLYQSVKCMSACEFFSKPDAVYIICCECSDGIGGDDFYSAVKGCQSAEQLLDDIAGVPMEETRRDQWQYQILARVLRGHRVFFVTRPELRDVVRDMKMEYFPSLASALAAARKEKGPDAHVVSIPDGVSVLPADPSPRRA